MSPFTIFLLLLAVLAGVLGFMKGFVRQAGSIAGLIAGVVACRLYGPDATRWLARVSSSADDSTMVAACAYAGLFVVAYLACVLLAGLLRKLLSGLRLGLVDRLAGAALKILVWAMLASVALNVWVAVMPDKRPSGTMARKVEQLAPALAGMALGEMPSWPEELKL